MSWYTDVSTWTRRPPVIQVYNDQGESFDYLPERTCELNGSISWEWHTTSTTFYTHSLSCGHNVTTTEQEPPSYCEECGAKVVES